MSSTTRVTNLGVSGMDIDQTVKDLMAAKRAPYDKMFQKKTLAEWKKASYNNGSGNGSFDKQDAWKAQVVFQYSF